MRNSVRKVVIVGLLLVVAAAIVIMMFAVGEAFGLSMKVRVTLGVLAVAFISAQTWREVRARRQFTAQVHSFREHLAQLDAQEAQDQR